MYVVNMAELACTEIYFDTQSLEGVRNVRGVLFNYIQCKCQPLLGPTSYIDASVPFNVSIPVYIHLPWGQFAWNTTCSASKSTPAPPGATNPKSPVFSSAPFLVYGPLMLVAVAYATSYSGDVKQLLE
jgi:hypothetical protein